MPALPAGYSHCGGKEQRQPQRLPITCLPPHPPHLCITLWAHILMPPSLSSTRLHHMWAHFLVQVLPEKEAKAIASQIFDGLAYLNGPSRRIIHYDLKPANILFNQLGEVKITVSSTLLQPPPPRHPPPTSQHPSLTPAPVPACTARLIYTLHPP